MHWSRRFIAGLFVGASIFLSTMPADARTLLTSICRVKGQEENTIQGMGLVIGLAGTGDTPGFMPTNRALFTMLQRMNNPTGEKGMLELKDSKNVALVMVTATIPAEGARQGDKIDCTVSSIGSAKSLDKGVLLTTPLLGPQVGDQRVYGFAQGPIHLEDTKIKTTGKINQGCRVEENFNNPFINDGKFTLVINKHLAGFQVAQDIAEQIDGQLRSTYIPSVSRTGAEGPTANKGWQAEAPRLKEEVPLARAIDALNVEVTIPPDSYSDPVEFVSRVLSLPMLEPPTPARVVINERAGTIVMSADVEIGAVLIHNKGMVIEAGQPDTGNRFVALETATKPTAKLQSLVEALNGLKVPSEDIISIIKTIDRDGKLHGVLIIE